MARKHTQLAKSRLLQYTEISASKIPVGETVYEVSSLPGTVDTSKEFIYVTGNSKYYRITGKEPVQYDSGTAESGILIGEPAVNVASGYESIFIHTYSPSDSSTTNNGLSVYKPITETITFGTGSMYTPTAQAVNDFVVPKYDTTYTTATPSITMHENTIYHCTHSAISSLELDISYMVDGPKTRESVVYFHTTPERPSLTIRGKDKTPVFGDENLAPDKDYKISVKDNSVTITPFVGNLATVATTGSYNDLINKPTIPSAPVQSDWNETNTSSLAYINNKPTIPASPVQSNWNETDTSSLAYIQNKPTIPAAPVQSDWEEANTSSLAYIQNKPTLFSGSYTDLTNKPTNATFGQGITYEPVQNSSSSGATIDVTFGTYSLTAGGVLSISFANNVGASAKLNIGNKGAKAIWYGSSAITEGVIKAGDRCVFMYSVTVGRYYLLAIDRWGVDINTIANSLSAVATSGDYEDLTNKPTIPTVPTDVSAFNNDAGYLTSSSVDVSISETSTNPVQNKAIGSEIRKLWEGVDVMSRLDVEYEQHNGYVAPSNGAWNSSTTYKHWIVPVDGIRKVVLTANDNTDAYYTFFSSYTESSSVPTTTYATGYTTAIGVSAGSTATIFLPCDANYMYLNTGSNGAAKASSIKLTGIGITEHCGTSSQFVKANGSLDSTEYAIYPSLAGNSGKFLSVNSGANGVQWVGVVTIYSGSSAPSSDVGVNGDIYIQTVS